MSEKLRKIQALSPREREALMNRLGRSPQRRAARPRSDITARPAANREIASLSFAQERLWFLHQLDPDSSLYNLSYAVRLTGVLDRAALDASFSELVRRHEILRTTYALLNARPVQMIRPAVEICPPLADLSLLEEGRRESAARTLLAIDADQAFDLSSGPTFRASLIKLSEKEHLLSVCSHHIAGDGWSDGVMIRELGAMYRSFVEGISLPPAPLPIQYADYSQWQRDLFQGERLEQELSFWEQSLAGAPPVLKLPTDRPRPQTPGYRGAQRSLALTPLLVERLKKLAASESATLFMATLAAFQVLLARYANQDELVIGTPVAGRVRPETEGLIGCFINMLALRADLGGNPSFRRVLRQARETTLEALSHADLPFEKIVERVQPERDLGLSPLFQVMFVFSNASGRTLDLPDLKLQGVATPAETSKYELTMLIEEAGQELNVALNYRTDLFQAATIDQMLLHFQRLLEGFTEQPERGVHDAPMLSMSERERILVDWNATQKEYTGPLCLHQIIESKASLFPDQTAVIDGNRRTTYRELNARANRLARRLIELGVGPERLVGVSAERSLEMVVALLATLKTGGAYLPLDPSLPSERLEGLARDAGVNVVLVQSHLSDSFPTLSAKLVLLDDENREREPHLDASMSEDLKARLFEENIAYVIYTSGSTGQPKGAMNTHRAICNRLLWMQDAYRLTHGDRVLQKTPFSFDVSVWEFFWPLIAGATLVMAAPEGHKDPDYLADCIERNEITVIHFVPSMLHAFLNARGLERAASLKKVICSGEALSAELQTRFFERLPGAELHNLYGPTEAAVDVSFWACLRDDRSTPPIGRPIANTRLYVLNSALEPVPIGTEGELYIGGIAPARGYLNRPDLTAGSFLPDLSEMQIGARMYKTGDLVRCRRDGNLEYLGRVDHQIKLRGFRIELGEIETWLNRFPAVSESVVAVREGRGGNKRLIAYLVPRTGAEIDVARLRQFLSQELPDYMLPSAFITLPAMPLNRNGKIDRKALPLPEQTAELERAAYVMPESAVEKALAQVWREVLGLKRVGIDDDYFALGGDSIRSIQVRALADERGLHFSLQDLFRLRTIRALAAEAGETGELESPVDSLSAFSLLSEQDRALAPEGVEDAYPLTWLQGGMIFHSEWAPELSFYHDLFSYRLRARFHQEALADALDRLVAQHPTLRTSFELSLFSEPLQLVHKSVAPWLDIIDLCDQTESRQETVIGAFLKTEAARPFKWDEPPLIRFIVHLCGPDQFQFTVSFHHALLDGWSLASMLAELFRNYFAASEGERPAQQLVDTTFREFVALEQEALKSERSRRYWTEKLSGMSQTELPRLTRSDRTVEPSPSQLILPIPITAEISEGLKRLAQRQAVPLKSLLLAAHCKALSVACGQTDIVTGVVSNGRPEKVGGDRALGLFLNTLPFRMDLAAGTWASLAQRAFVEETELLPHRRYPMPKIKNDLGAATLFETAFNYTHFHVYQGLESFGEAAVMGTASYERTDFILLASFSLRVKEGDVQLSLTCDSSLIDQEQAELIAGYYQRALERMAFEPDAAHHNATLLSTRELAWIGAWNETESERERELCSQDLFERQCERTPERKALIYEEETISYGELNRRSNRLAHWLIAQGVGPESRVGICLPRSIGMASAVLAVLKASGCYLPLDASLPAERLRYMVADGGAELILCGAEQRENFEDLGVRTATPEELGAELERQSGSNPVRRAEPDNLAYVIYTSGSTGRPKGIAMPHGPLVNLIQWHQRELMGEAMTLQFASLGFDASYHEMFGCWAGGGTVVMIPELDRMDPEKAADLIERWKIEKAILPVVMLQELSSAETRGKLSSLREAIATGEQLVVNEQMREGLEREGLELHNHYGPSESHVVTAHRLSNSAREWPGLPPIGRAISNSRIYVLDKQGREVAPGAVGEIYIGGECLARCYLNRADLTAERFCPDGVSGRAGERLYRSGDLGRYDAEGNLQYLGRGDRQVKVRGHRIELSEIETTLSSRESVSEAIVELRGVGSEKELTAYVVKKAEAGPDWIRELREEVRKRLPVYMAPSRYVEIEKIPLTANGKVDRAALARLEAAQEPERKEKQGPADEIEAAIVGIWERVLGREGIGVDENFFELGGHSLKATQAASRISRELGKQISLRDLFSGPTVRELAEKARQGQATVKREYVRSQDGEEYELSAGQKSVWIESLSEEGSRAYNLPMAYVIEGDLDEEKLEEAFLELVERRPTLRTRIVEREGEPRQRIEPPEGIRLERVDVRGEGSEEAGRALSRAEASKAFDLKSWPLLRAKLARMEEKKWMFLLTMHHILADGWSQRLLMSELTELYQSRVEGRASRLKEARGEYRDYVAEEKRAEESEEGRRGEEYWKAKLKGVMERKRLETDYPRGAKRGYRGGVVSYELGEEQSRGLRRLGADLGASLFMTLLAGVKSLMYRLTGEEQAVVGSPVMRRGREEEESGIGLYLNTVALKTEVKGSDRLAEVVEKVKETTLEGMEHSGVSLEKVMREMRRESAGKGGSLYDVVATMGEEGGEAPEGAELKGLRIEEWGEWNDASKNEIWISFSERGERIGVSINYDGELYKEQTGRLLGERLEKVLSQMSEDAQRRVEEIEFGEWSPLQTAAPEIQLAF